MADKSDVAIKIMQGIRLNFDEFKTAVQHDFLSNVPATTDKELAEAYLQFVGQCYEDDTRQGYLCSKTPTRITKIEKTEDGRDKKSICMWGVHLDEVKPEFLSKENIKFLRHYFGKEKVREFTGK